MMENLKMEKCMEEGNLKFPDDSRYIGEFKDGEFHGEKELYAFRGGRYEGEWKNGKLSWIWNFTLDGGVRYEGQFKNGKFHGEGKSSKKRWFNVCR